MFGMNMDEFLWCMFILFGGPLLLRLMLYGGGDDGEDTR